MAIKGIIIVNNMGKVRLMKFYEDIPYDTQQKAIRECYSLVHKRGNDVCNFVEGGSIWGRDTKLIYQKFATLYFIFAVDESESELGILDLITGFVEVLDKSFQNVCELDLIFHSDKVHYILDEIIQGGMVLETDKNEVLAEIIAQNKEEYNSKHIHSTVKKIGPASRTLSGFGANLKGKLGGYLNGGLK